MGPFDGSKNAGCLFWNSKRNMFLPECRPVGRSIGRSVGHLAGIAEPKNVMTNIDRHVSKKIVMVVILDKYSTTKCLDGCVLRSVGRLVGPSHCSYRRRKKCHDKH
jgi:hypothetical protein